VCASAFWPMAMPPPTLRRVTSSLYGPPAPKTNSLEGLSLKIAMPIITFISPWIPHDENVSGEQVGSHVASLGDSAFEHDERHHAEKQHEANDDPKCPPIASQVWRVKHEALPEHLGAGVGWIEA